MAEKDKDKDRAVPEDGEEQDELSAEEEEAARAKKAKLMKMGLIGIGVVIALLLAGGISFFVAKTFLHSANNPVDPGQYHDPGVFIKLGKGDDGIVVNVGGNKGGHFLKIGLILELNPGKKDNVVDGKIQPFAETKIQDSVLQVLRSEPLESFEASKQGYLKEKIKTEVDNALGGGSVYSVYITSFILQ